jgi:non-heme chloroperoxidase
MLNYLKREGAALYYKDWGTGQPIVFSHGWPLSSDAWDAQMMFFGTRGYRVIAHDRRGHGRSTQAWSGNDMDTYADDLAGLLDELDLRNAVLVGHSTGGGEVVRCIARHGKKRVAKCVLVGSVTPVMVKSAANPEGLPMSTFDEIRKMLLANRSQYFSDFAVPFYGYNRKGVTPSQGVIDSFWLQSMMAGIKPVYDCVQQFSETDFTEDLKRIDVPTMIVHGDDDQIVPIGISAQRATKLVKTAQLKIYKGAPHGLPTTHADQLNQDMLGFLQGM